MKNSYLAYGLRLEGVGLGAVFVCPVVGALGAVLGFNALLFSCVAADRSDVSPRGDDVETYCLPDTYGFTAEALAKHLNQWMVAQMVREAEKGMS